MNWTKEKVNYLKELVPHKTDIQAAEAFRKKYKTNNISYKSIETKRRGLGIVKKGGFEAQKSEKYNNLPNIPVFLDKKKSKNINWREWFKNLEERQKLHQKTSSSQDEATVQIDTDKSIYVCLSADWHMGSATVDYQSLQNSFETILNTDRVYIITIGDLIDNFRSFRSLQPILSQVISPKEQKTILSSILQEFFDKKKWIAACWGNHDIERDERLYGESTIKDLLAEKLVYFNGKGTLNLIVGEQKYVIRMSHQFKGNSIYNPNHSMNRELKWNTPYADLIVGAHKHKPAIQSFYEYGKRKALIQVGTFQTDDGFSKRWWSKGVIGVPTVVFRADRHEVFVYPSLNELLEKF